MNTKSFFTKIREIIREEIEYAIDKKLAKPNTKKSDISSLEHGLSLYKEAQSPKKQVVAKTKKTEFSSINDLLAETRRSLQESSDMENEFRFTSDMAEGFGYERGGSVIPQGYSSEQIPTEVMSALTKDYSALMKKIDEKKGR